eukprot:scaffold1001_cov191-Alexandrium_tamarense.AAC.5
MWPVNRLRWWGLICKGVIITSAASSPPTTMHPSSTTASTSAAPIAPSIVQILCIASPAISILPGYMAPSTMWAAIMSNYSGRLLPISHHIGRNRT